MSPTPTSSTSQHMVTRCPKCSTAFRITHAQLALAKGAVRCGSCLHVFKAADNLVKSVSSDDKKTIPSSAENSLLKSDNKSATPSEKQSMLFDKSKALADEEDELISDDMDKAKNAGGRYEFDGFLDVDLQPKQTMSLFEREIKFEHDDETPKPTDDESWAEELLDDDEPTRPIAKKVVAAHEEIIAQVQPDTTPHTDTVKSSMTFSIIEEESVTQNSLTDDTVSKEESPYSSFPDNWDESDNSNSEHSHSNRHEEPEFSEEFLSMTQHSPTDSTTKETNTPDFAAELFGEPEPGNATASEPQAKPKKAIKSAYKTGGFGMSRAAMLMNIIPAPLEFTTRGGKKRLKQKLWASLAVLTGVTLLAQVAYFKFDYFGRIEPYRSIYALTCPMFGCKVPNLIDTSKIVIYDTHSRSHPHSKDALLLEFIMRNDAAYEQPFPNVLLSFSTVGDTPVAARLFKPNEYLGGELAGKEFIPPKTPVHIEIELKDPGADAVNYEVTIK